MREKFITANRTALRIADSKRGERVIVLLHGYLESLEVWDDFARLLTPHARVIALDLPGHGISEVKGPVHTMEYLGDTVYEALRALQAERYTLVGHSMGGYAALALAERHPEVLSGLVLFHSTPNADSEQKRADREREIALVEAGKKELLARTLPAAGFAEENRTRCAAWIEDLREMACLTEDEGITALLRGMCQRSDRNRMLRESPVRQLFILGRKDPYITPSVAEAMVAAHAQARVAWLENSGHMGFVEEPEASARALLDFAR